MTDKGIKFVQNVANIVAHKTNFYTIDIGQKINGDWTVIELNDGQMAGLSLCSPDELYRNLYIETLGM